MNPDGERDHPWASHRARNDVAGTLTEAVMIASAVTLLVLLVSIAFPHLLLLLVTLVVEGLAMLTRGDGRD